MTENASPEGLAAETSAPEAMSEEQELSAAFDRAQGEQEAEPETPDSEDAEAQEPDTASEGAEEPEDAEDAQEAEPEPVEAPTELPKAIRDDWGKMSETAREAILSRERESNRKLADMGRQVQGIAPIRDVLVEAIQKLPAMSDMRPQDVAREAFQLAEMAANFRQKPVETMLGLVRQHGLERAMAQALQGQQPQQEQMRENALLQKISHLERQLQQVADPSYVDQRVSYITEQRAVTDTVHSFASSAEHWADVENELPRFIAAVQAINPDASPQDALREAYEMAVAKLVPEDKRAKPEGAAAKAAPKADPERVQAALKAKSVNVQGKSSGKPRRMSEEEELAAVFDRLQS